MYLGTEKNNKKSASGQPFFFFLRAETRRRIQPQGLDAAYVYIYIFPPKVFFFLTRHEEKTQKKNVKGGGQRSSGGSLNGFFSLSLSVCAQLNPFFLVHPPPRFLTHTRLLCKFSSSSSPFNQRVMNHYRLSIFFLKSKGVFGYKTADSS